ncbi:Scr1 family TA system antitoxin-like transcriptional regulator [Kibdelosporangium persicum]|uniref:Scr1 family TA system antitoxin-like transcriptional regulator n=1 Tax=Kibdelosporangium persicum TaxID=2698649 RepID=UPI001FE7DF54|nr:Scr1 family TA system antitoxin-like transcriptional regulator [Kibdelosporangium persicum]
MTAPAHDLRLSRPSALAREFGDRLRRQRERMHLTMDQAAAQVGFDPDQVTAIESGYLPPHVTAKVENYLSALGCTTPELQREHITLRQILLNLGFWLCDRESLTYHETHATRCVSYHPYSVPDAARVAAQSAKRPQQHRIYLIDERALTDPQQDAGWWMAALAPMTGLDSVAIRVVPHGPWSCSDTFRILEGPGHNDLVHLPSGAGHLLLEAECYTRHYRDVAAKLLANAHDADRSRDLLSEHSDWTSRASPTEESR